VRGNIILSSHFNGKYFFNTLNRKAIYSVLRAARVTFELRAVPLCRRGEIRKECTVIPFARKGLLRFDRNDVVKIVFEEKGLHRLEERQ